MAVAAAAVCLISLLPRPFRSLHVHRLRAAYLTRSAQHTLLDLLDTDIEMHVRDAGLIHRKTWSLLAAVTILWVAGALVTAGILF